MEQKYLKIFQDENYFFALDICVLIYFFENHTLYGEIMRTILDTISNTKNDFYISSIAIVEILPNAYRHYPELSQVYEQFFQEESNQCSIVPVYESTAVLASSLIVKYNLMLPDSIQIACALEGGATHFLTNDKTLKKVTELKVICLDDFL